MTARNDYDIPTEKFEPMDMQGFLDKGDEDLVALHIPLCGFAIDVLPTEMNLECL